MTARVEVSERTTPAGRKGRTLHELGGVASDLLERDPVSLDPRAVLAMTCNLAFVSLGHEPLAQGDVRLDVAPAPDREAGKVEALLGTERDKVAGRRAEHGRDALRQRGRVGERGRGEVEQVEVLLVLERVAWGLTRSELLVYELGLELELNETRVAALGGVQLKKELLVAFDDDDQARIANSVRAVL